MYLIVGYIPSIKRKWKRTVGISKFKKMENNLTTGPFKIPIDRLLSLCNPFKTNPWIHGLRLTKKEIRQAIKENRFQTVPSKTEENIYYHIERVAYLTKFGWNDPVEIDVGVPELGCYVDWPLVDGNHRFVAALMKKKKSILANVSGSLDYASDLFGMKI